MIPGYYTKAGESIEGLLFRITTGNRHVYTGVLSAVGNGGYSWASSVYTDYRAYNLNFNQGGLNPSNVNNRANGFQVRCLRAFTNGFVLFFSIFNSRQDRLFRSIPAVRPGSNKSQCAP